MLEAYNQRAPLFDPEKSSTYKNVSCSSSLCLQGSPCSGSNNQFTNILWSMVIHHSQMETLLEQWNIYITLATIRKVGFSLLNFLSAFGFMLSSICIILSCFHFVCLFLLGCLVFFFFFQNKKRKIRRKKNTKTVCVCVCWYLCTFDGYWNKVSKLCISCSLDKHLNAQLSKWAL